MSFKDVLLTADEDAISVGEFLLADWVQEEDTTETQS